MINISYWHNNQTHRNDYYYTIIVLTIIRILRQLDIQHLN